eukprot:CAMPEP_0197541048 /NCGR_PEP_ID=MMETSP1318-20131121/66939_1 /TAXON_ID=552666 /ORGANISM="Partenskyella glossopodia, Strain RCC365" /LENGTH=80 /DNA_ID=CAMNT_0043100181 /DNA_START=287 /DNA_END=529 /DNA_ORIENTATION=+
MDSGTQADSSILEDPEFKGNPTTNTNTQTTSNSGSPPDDGFTSLSSNNNNLPGSQDPNLLDANGGKTPHPPWKTNWVSRS